MYINLNRPYHVFVKVPVGTLVKELASGKLLADLDEAGKKFIAARGGAGGHGNEFFVSNTNKAPQIAERGEPLLNCILILYYCKRCVACIIHLEPSHSFWLLGIRREGRAAHAEPRAPPHGAHRLPRAAQRGQVVAAARTHARLPARRALPVHHSAGLLRRHRVRRLRASRLYALSSIALSSPLFFPHDE